MTESRAAAPELRPLAPDYDPWDPLPARIRYGAYRLTSVELTVTNLCNMRCEHCAVGDSLTMSEGERLPVADVLRALDRVEHLETVSITGGEPSFREDSVRDYIVPILRYARERGLRSQVNSNLTLGYERYALMAPWLDVMHITYNYAGPDDFREIGFARADRPAGRDASGALYERMMENARRLSDDGLFVSAETMINTRTAGHIGRIHRTVADIGCRRHEVHPMYPSSFAMHLPTLALPEFREAVHRLLDERAPGMWILFGTFPFYRCSPDGQDRQLWDRIKSDPLVTVRNDPDGRNRLNVNTFSGDVFVTDFAADAPLGNVARRPLDAIFADWLDHPQFAKVNCECPAAGCLGPNLLVADAYYRDVDFSSRQALF